MRRLIIALILASSFPLFGWGQYALDESGIGFSGGLGVAFGDENQSRFWETGVDGFWSHYTCGKAYGFHFTGGLHFLSGGPRGRHKDSPQAYAGHQLALVQVGAFGKMRIHSYHRPRELAFLFGVKVDYAVWQSLQSDYLASYSLNHLFPRLHGSVFLRRPLGDDHSLFIRPGVDFFLSPLFEYNNVVDRTYRVSPIMLNLELGFTLWDNRG